MKIDRPLWVAGALLSPQQFQQQARWEAWTNECIAHLSQVHPWGVQAVAFDLEALRLNRVKATQLRVRLPDGTLIDSNQVDPLPPALDLAQLPSEPGQQVVLLLALPLLQANGGNCLIGESRPSRPVRYRQEWRDVADLHGEDSQSMAVMQHVLTLRLDSDDNAEYLTCPIARLVRDGQGGWSLDDAFVPPLLDFAAHPGLLAQLDNLLTQLSAKRTRLMGMRRESNQRMADFAVADVSLFWLLNALNSYQPVLSELVAHPARHPELVYLELSKLAGSLLTFSLEHDIGAIPTAYALARTHLHGLAGLEEGLALIRAQLQTDWPRFWPPALPARLEILAWLFSHLQPRLRRIDGTQADLSSLKRIQGDLQALDAVLEREVALPLHPLQALQAQLERLVVRLDRERDRLEAPAVPATPDVEISERQPDVPAAYQRLVYVVQAPAPSEPVAVAPRWARPVKVGGLLALAGLLVALHWYLG
ncbi:type VI secretion system baseplate subunit TssK [Pseudomonas knackmussii]|uniref:type VI secretion system baseplate subunit TssK n=1 Tax=Pseudomonas knackmussii TaxID=65741 RepID=UPI003F4A42EE